MHRLPHDLRIALFGLAALALALTARNQPQPRRSWLAGLALGLGINALLHGLARISRPRIAN